VLESQVRIAIAETGLDPSIGYLHVCQPGRQALVYDLMEPGRPQVDQEVLNLVRSSVFTPRDFVIDSKGVCRLHPELAREVARAGVTQGSLAATVGFFEVETELHGAPESFKNSAARPD
jgi:CRISPR/Cas system-associated endonuclease Cas1